ncbi:MAG: alanine and proline-rich secreted protein Apa [Oscillospiraceae bacterium]|nr:alanine and proline-rich secreted protein Apa [Oscillospiraceae bacterium]
MKKLLVLTLALLMVLTLVACGGGTAPPANGAPTATPPQNDTPSPTPDNSGDNGNGGSSDNSDTNTPEPPPATNVNQLTITNNSGSTFHLVEIVLGIGKYQNSDSYDVIEDGDTVTFDFYDFFYDSGYMLGALETDGFSAHRYGLPYNIPSGSTIVLLPNHEFSIVDPDGNVSN